MFSSKRESEFFGKIDRSINRSDIITTQSTQFIYYGNRKMDFQPLFSVCVHRFVLNIIGK